VKGRSSLKNVTPSAPTPDVADAPERRPAPAEVDGPTLRKLLADAGEDFANRAYHEFGKVCADGLSEDAARRKPNVFDRVMKFELEFPDGPRCGKMTVLQIYEILASAADGKKQKQRHEKGAFAGRDSINTYSAEPIIEFNRMIASQQIWTLPPDDYPYCMNKGKNFIISLQGEPLREGIAPEHAAALQPVFESIVDPKTIILFAACMDRWIEARRTGANLTQYQAVRIHVNDMCELFGYKKHGKGGYQLAHKREVFRRLQELDILRGHGIVSNGKGGRMEFRGSFANVTFYRTVPLIGTPEPWEVIVRPGDAFAAMIEANPSEMRLYSKLAPFIAGKASRAKGGLKNEYAGKIGIYLCGIFRIRQKDVSFSDPITIGTILGGAGIVTDMIPQHYLRFREAIEDALDLLQEEKTRNGIFSTLRTAAKLVPLGILTGIRLNKPRPITGSTQGRRSRATRSPLGWENIISFRVAISENAASGRPSSVSAALEPVPHDLAAP
jgi:hypothetical protein